MHVLNHEHDILSDGLDLLIVVDLLRITAPLASQHAYHAHEADEDTRRACRDLHASHPQQEVVGGGGGLDDGGAHHADNPHTPGDTARQMGGREGIGAVDRDALWLQPLFASCTVSSNTAPDATLQRILAHSGVLGQKMQLDALPCSLSTHLFGGRPERYIYVGI